MRRSGIVAGLTGVALVVAVVAVRDGTAADDADLAVGPAEPSPVPSEPDLTPVLLAANGVPGLRLGSARTASAGSVGRTTSGCRLFWEDAAGTSGSTLTPQEVGWETGAWVVDDQVVSVVLQSWNADLTPTDLLRTWLGPTLGSPIEAAKELPGAETVTHRPFGADGPEVDVVTVPERGVEVVYSDLPPWSGPEPADRVGGRISTIEVRKAAGRPCATADLAAPSAARPPAGPVVDVDGVGPFRLGTPVAELTDVEGVVPAGTFGQVEPDGTQAGSCQAFDLETGPDTQEFVRAAAHDGVVTEVQAYGPGTTTTFGLPDGADIDDVHALFPETADRADPLWGTGAVVVEVDGTTVELQMHPAQVWLPDLERQVEGGIPLLQGVVLRTPGTPQYAC